MSRRGRSAFLAAGAAALALSHAAHSGAVRRAFTVRAVVIASARVSSAIQASGDAVEIRAVGHRSVPAALLVDGQVKVLESAAILAIPTRGEFAVTVLY
jgi:hypothetical protein